MLIRVSIEVPNAPRFLITFSPRHFESIKSFINYLCQQTGLNEDQSKPNYLLMLEDSVMLSIVSIRDGD